ncbi:MAG: carbon-nitrogen hydrolase family protein [Oscillospiraceae bacterium]|nr:carbon-nitrogen hydrolase family protein [Oscillospiraceae bacterium]
MDKNLLENTEWTKWSPRPELSPEFFNENNKLKISANNSANLYGKFISGEIRISSAAVVFEASFLCGNVKNEEKSVFALLNFYDNEKTLLERSYADIITDPGGKKLYRKLSVPENAAYVTIELGLRWSAGSFAEFNNISLKETEAGPQRLVKIATTYQEQKNAPEENLREMINVIEKAGAAGVDVILLSELVYESYCIEPIKAAQPIPGHLTGIIGKYAQKYNAYIIFSMNELDGGIIYNTAVIIDRGGKVCGKYRKIHLPLNEAEMGVTPGDCQHVFDLDFGRIGIIICYDQYFPESSRTLALMGAEIIFNPTQGEDELVQRAAARTNGVYVAVSGFGGPESSRIINPLGEVVSFVQNTEDGYAIMQADLCKRHFVRWMSVGPGNGELNSLFKKERAVNTYININKETHKITENNG